MELHTETIGRHETLMRKETPREAFEDTFTIRRTLSCIQAHLRNSQISPQTAGSLYEGDLFLLISLFVWNTNLCHHFVVVVPAVFECFSTKLMFVQSTFGHVELIISPPRWRSSSRLFLSGLFFVLFVFLICQFFFICLHEQLLHTPGSCGHWCIKEIIIIINAVKSGDNPTRMLYFTAFWMHHAERRNKRRFSWSFNAAFYVRRSSTTRSKAGFSGVLWQIWCHLKRRFLKLCSPLPLVFSAT